MVAVAEGAEGILLQGDTWTCVSMMMMMMMMGLEWDGHKDKKAKGGRCQAK